MRRSNRLPFRPEPHLHSSILILLAKYPARTTSPSNTDLPADIHLLTYSRRHHVPALRLTLRRLSIISPHFAARFQHLLPSGSYDSQASFLNTAHRRPSSL